MFSRNRHLNIFEHYVSAGTLPIENNVSRGFAIVLESYPLVLDRFIDYINAKCREAGSGIVVSKPDRTDDFDVGFQQSIRQIAASYSELSSVIGITLTANAADGDSGIRQGQSSDLITDIVVVVGDAAIIVEVKRTGENAAAQCLQQVDSFIGLLCEGSSTSSIDRALLGGTWEEVIGLLEKSRLLLHENDRGVLAQYLQHIELRYQQWFPVKKLSEIEFSEENAPSIEKRLAVVAQNSCDEPDEARRQWGGFTVPAGKPYAGGVLIVPNYASGALEIKTWVGDTKSQGLRYFEALRGDLSWVYERQLGVGSELLSTEVSPYLRFAHFQRTIFNEYLLDGFFRKELGADKRKWHELWQAVSREWGREEWGSLLRLLETEYTGAVNEAELRRKMVASFEESNRTYAHVSLGFEVAVRIPHAVIVAKELSSDVTAKQADMLAGFIHDTVIRLFHRVE